MEIETQKMLKKVYDGEEGSYYSWDPFKLPMLSEANVGAGRLCLKKNGFALPHYADSSKVGYVLQGNGVVGMVRNGKEKVFAIKKGDAIAVPFSVVSWWFNKEDTDLLIVFLGDTSKAHNRGDFTYFLLAGAVGIFTGFSLEFLSRAWDLPEDVVKTVVTSQSAGLLTKLADSSKMPEPRKEDRDGVVFNCEEANLSSEVDVKNGGRMVVLDHKKIALLSQVGLGADLVRLDPRAMCSPGFSSDSAVQVTYIVRGSGRVQVVGAYGKRALDAAVKAGDLFIVPRFFVVSKIAGDDGLEWFSVITTPEPVFTQLAGKTSVWKAMSAEVVEAAFNVPKFVEQQFRSANSSNAIFFPPPN